MCESSTGQKNIIHECALKKPRFIVVLKMGFVFIFIFHYSAPRLVQQCSVFCSRQVGKDVPVIFGSVSWLMV